MERIALAGVIFLIMATTACQGVDELTAPPLIDWDGVAVATVHPIEPTGDDPEICETMYEEWEKDNTEPIWDECREMSTEFRDLVLEHFDDSTFRDDDLNCQEIELALTDFLGSWESRSIGTHDDHAGLSAYGETKAYGVWFNEIYPQVSEKNQRLAAAHEGYHLAFLDDDEDKAQQAAEYCFGYSEEHPWVPE